MQRQLELLKDFQSKYPDSHVGGSIGLHLLGWDLKRDMSLSDLDIVTKGFDIDKHFAESPKDEQSSDTSDFHLCIRHVYENESYVRIDIRVADEPFTIVNHNGIDYNVSLLEDILKFKRAYAEKGIDKHIEDLATIEGRPTI